MLATLHKMELQSHDDVFTISYTTEGRIYLSHDGVCLTLEIGTLFDISMKDCMFNIFIHENSEGCSIMNFDSNWVYSRARGRLIIGVVGHPHHSPLLALHSNLNPNEFLCLMPNSPSHHHAILCINNFLSYQLQIFFDRHFYASKIQRGNEACQFICRLCHSRFLTIIFHGKIGSTVCK